MSIVTDALSVASAGLACFPANDRKHPLIKQWQVRASTNPDAVRRLFSLSGAMLIGVPTGQASGFDLLDIDPSSLSDLTRHGGRR